MTTPGRMSATPILSLLSRPPTGVARVKPPRLHHRIRHRSMYSSAPGRKRKNESPSSALKSVTSSTLPKTAAPPATSTGGSTRRVMPSITPASRTAPTLSQSLNRPGFNKNKHRHLGADVDARESSRLQSRSPVIRPGKANSPEYRSAARKWVASIIALPIFIVTSYFLFDRCMPPL